ncbi:MAG: hypothetical protein KKF54_03915 [Candidatus Omnitrophica bacterium]|nr:hypothetical protein [Candidatus Omnitrophota bacterium]
MTQSINNKVLSRIYCKKRGWVFTPVNFLDLGSRAAIDQILGRLARSGTIRRLARGLYDYPRKHPDFGDIPSNYERIAQVLAGRDSLKIQPSGAYAANLLGLSDQVPAKIVFLTDGHSRTVKVGKLTIKLKRTTPKNMATAGRISGLVIQALRYLKKNNVDSAIIAKLKRRLSGEDKSILMRDLRYAPVWIGEIFRRLI